MCFPIIARAERLRELLPEEGTATLERMRRADLADLLLLGLMWGASFLFIKEALADFTPVTLVTVRLLLGVLTIAVIVAIGRHSLAGFQAKWPALALLGVSNAILPFVLISWGELYIPTGLAAILNATTPLFAAPIAHGWVGSQDRLTVPKGVGIVVGFVGVVVLLGVGRSSVTSEALLGGGAVLLASLAYAFSSVFARARLQAAPPLLAPIGQSGFGFLLLAPLALPVLPSHLPGLRAVASLLALGVLGTGVAYLLYFRLIRNVGPTRAVLVTYLLPCTAVFWGILLLHERPGPNVFVGLVLILTGISFTLGLVPRVRGGSILAAGRRPLD